MDNIKFISALNSVDKIYDKFGIIVPTTEGEGAKPSVKLIKADIGQTYATLYYNTYSDSEYTIYYTLNEGESVDFTPARAFKIELDNLEHNSSNTVSVTVTNETGTTTHTYTFTTEYWTNWASADEILEGNKAISDGVEVIGTIPTMTDEDITVEELTVTIPAGYYAEEVEVEVPGVIPTETITLTANGTYDVTNYATAIVDYPEIHIVECTQAEYDAMETHDPDTYYAIID